MRFLLLYEKRTQHYDVTFLNEDVGERQCLNRTSKI